MNGGGLLTAWRIWDQIYYHCTRLKYVDKENRNLFRVVVKRYSGEPLVTSDGVSLKKGDWYAKLHLHNCLFAQMIREQSLDGISLALFTVNSIRGSLPALARYVANHPRSEEIQVLLGTTFLHRGARRLGFDVSDMVCSPYYLRYKSWLFKLILANCHPDGWRRLQEAGHQLVPKRVYISKEEFFKRYLLPQ
ncbi:hypothetical protein CLV97_105133 [Planifilum fimeticola]|jgi:hypothetical protein|uniref:YkoP-like domain-containing protein n=1 Tax=Planifilum fimeticola TaxID=201975 RepID=A0A2T0LH82_9BACL|nr:hypothetical protein [Planifilum fimeticola]PRX41701.1 hypothetical protein CLV97_105133 [Planifilum fimeticola]